MHLMQALDNEQHDPAALYCLCAWCESDRAEVAMPQETVTICHFSDWHGCWHKLPKADLYICTGDMLYNYPSPKGITIHHRETYCQGKAVQGLGNLREKLGIPEKAPVVVVRGNHDFVSLVKLFGEEHTYEVNLSATTFHDLCSLQVGGFRGVNFAAGEWSDELRDDDLDKLARALPLSLDILVTHAPPYGILDNKGTYSGRSPRFGLRAAASYINRQDHMGARLRLHCFGHIHSGRGLTTRGKRPHWVYFSNASESYNLFEWNQMRIRPKTIKKLEGDGIQC